MFDYRLAKLAPKPRGKVTALLPPINGSLNQEQAYLKICSSMLRQLAAFTREQILPLAEAEIAAEKRNRITVDIDADIFNQLIQYAARLQRVASNSVNRILDLEGKKHTKTFVATAKKALGIDLAAVVTEEDLAGLLASAATRNASLIKSIGDDTIKRISQTVISAVLNGTPATELRKTLAADFGLSLKRAKVIARDQIAKLNSDLNRFRHKQAGIEKYTWRTSADERVRPRHMGLEGKIYAYGEPTGAENGLSPGQPIMCRCIAQAIVEFEG